MGGRGASGRGQPTPKLPAKAKGQRQSTRTTSFSETIPPFPANLANRFAVQNDPEQGEVSANQDAINNAAFDEPNGTNQSQLDVATNSANIEDQPNRDPLSSAATNSAAAAVAATNKASQSKPPNNGNAANRSNLAVNEGASTSGTAKKAKPSVSASRNTEPMNIANNQQDEIVAKSTRACTTLFTIIKKLHDKVVIGDILAMPLIGVKLYATNLEKYWNQYFESHMARVCEATQIGGNTERDQEFSKAEDMYNELSIALGLRLSQLEVDEMDRHSIHTTSDVHQSRNELKMGKIEIEIFDGTLERWPHFKAMFEQLVHTNNYETMAKFSYLTDHLKRDSEPFEIVDGFEKNPNGRGATTSLRSTRLCTFFVE